MNDRYLPSPAGTQLLVDVRGAEIIPCDDDSPRIGLPNHEEMISHIALDIGGSLAKVVYFTRTPRSSSRKPQPSSNAATTSSVDSSSSSSTPTTPHSTRNRDKSPETPPASPAAKPNGFLNPKSLLQRPSSIHAPTSSSYSSPAASRASSADPSSSTAPPPTPGSTSSSRYPPFSSHLRRRSSTSRIPSGGRLNFIKFETSNLSACIDFLSTLISSSASSNGVPLEVMKRSVKIMATGGGAHKYHQRLRDELGVEVRREEEMECLVLGLGFVMEVPNEVFWYSDELVQAISHPSTSSTTTFTPKGTLNPFHDPEPIPTSTSSTASPSHEDELPRPSPNPPSYSLSFDASPTPAQFPCLLVNIGSGVSIIKVDDYGKFERISGTSLGGGTLWGLLSLLTGAKSFDDMLALADKGDNSSVDMLVGDIYGQDYQKIGLKSSTIASSFGKVFRKDEEQKTVPTSDAASAFSTQAEDRPKKHFKHEDVSRSLLYAISNNIGQIAYMNAEKHHLDRIYFGGGFIRGHAATISTLSYAIRFWSKGTKKALFLRHEGYLGGIGAWLKNLSEGYETPVIGRGEVALPLPEPIEVGGRSKGERERGDEVAANEDEADGVSTPIPTPIFDSAVNGLQAALEVAEGKSSRT
ncbi:BZ3500_MvSof-1268-A1-R1_Chr7-1g09435 [Microbotryum saponariae]|uniref:BZ3500_MvSof-1268-A1-R1_Chr7-1g09435 protein n=1 Tax=Microbotryum saponariae TaxID=289078 RepID=A0A2X0LEE4_9BASI|nr:BZ3501_MvSof-1269-A2-R1_Chr7-1g09140 [Microbotryum saponariae]SDA03440.1 BZ3500_MvSof-1268-A1-R1_Chr7-1g09435 [Microbotryum saponariae]